MSETVGEQLKQAREERKLSLEQVFQATRISVRYLEALENNRRDNLPSPVQAKGFLRLYGDFLKLPVQELVDRWDGKMPMVIPLSSEEPAPAEESVTPEGEQLQPVETPVSSETSQEPEAEEDEEVVPIEINVEPLEPEEPPVDEPLPGHQLIFNEIGQALLERREALGLTLSDVERYTKLRQHYLKAMEDGRMNDLPSLVQGRGMISNYAKFLELDADALLGRFADALQQRRLETMPAGSAAAEPKSAPRKRKPAAPATPPFLKRLITPDLLIGSLVIFVIVGFAIWGAAQISAMGGEKTAPTAPPIANILAVTETPTQPLAEDRVDQPAQANPPASSSGEDTGGDSASVEMPASGETTPTSVPLIGDAPLQVYIVASDRAYMQVIEDGKVKFNGRVVAGNVYPFSGSKQVELVTGNAAALQVFFNQQDLGSLGLNGQVVRLIFNSKGVLTPTPSFSATPTQTLVPSMTPKPSPTVAKPTITPFIP